MDFVKENVEKSTEPMCKLIDLGNANYFDLWYQDNYDSAPVV